MRIRLEDVAARTGVSVATVSRVVNGKAGVSDETRRSVLATLELLGYERSSSTAQRSGLVGLIVPELTNPIYPAFVQELESALVAGGYVPLLCSATPILQEDEYVDMLMARGVAGMLYVAGRHANTDVDHSRYHQLRTAGVPMVLVNGYVDDIDAPFVSTDDVSAMRQAVAYLASLGHTDIGCAMGPARYSTSRRKVEGFVAGMAEASGSRPSQSRIVHSVYTVEGGRAAMEALLDEGVTAVVCGSDLMALGAIQAARGRGLDVPSDVSVMGYDGSPMVAFTDPPLSTMRQDVAGVSRHAVDALLSEVGGAPHPRREVLFAAELVVRGSTGRRRAG